MSKILIEVRDNVMPDDALARVFQVIQGGRVSENKHGKHYCWHTVFVDGIHVSVRPKRHPKAADSFIVYTGGCVRFDGKPINLFDHVEMWVVHNAKHTHSKIARIKALRIVLGIGLREAKDACEALYDSRGSGDPLPKYNLLTVEQGKEMFG